MVHVKYNKTLFFVMMSFVFTFLSAEEDVTNRHHIAINPPKHMPQEGHADIYAAASFIYWRATVPGHVLGYGNSSTVALPSTAGDTIYPDYFMRPGFRLDIGMVVDHDGWQVDLEYTWNRWNTDQSEIKSVNTNAAVLQFASPFGWENDNQRIEGYWNFALNRWDLNLGRPYFTGNWHSTYPYISLMGYSNKATFHMESDEPGKIDLNQELVGIGPALGVERAFCINKALSIFGSAKLSLPYNQMKATYVFTDETVGNNEFVNNGDEYYRLNQIIDILLGLRYENRWDHYYSSVQLGWENQIWINYLQQNGFRKLNRGTEDLSLTGLTAKVMFMF